MFILKTLFESKFIFKKKKKISKIKKITFYLRKIK